ncbi:MAG: DedA family protein [Candidatus Dadabacteria bacterium]|nr:DedA family protein [Candidatus Dadabacteria bacterium]NIQ13900.1 DedA family protein [Candidatus Dadabacteria bacterium]
MFKSFYNWILGWADKKSGVYALGFFSFIESSFFPIPPDPLLMALCLGKPKKSFYFGIICTIFSVLGAIGGYFIGWLLWEFVGNFFLEHIIKPEAFEFVSLKYKENAFLAVLGAALTPIPFKAFTVTAGVFKINIFILIIASIFGRAGRFITISALIYFFGPKIRVFIDRYFNILVTLLFILLILGFLAIKML